MTTPSAVPDPPPERDERDRVLDTYRYLRGGMVAIIVMLTASLLIYSFGHHCLGTSISAYYYTPVRAIFIASLCALGIMLIAYSATKDSEDILLDLAGVMAFVVAVVPTSKSDQGCESPFPIDDNILRESVHNNFVAIAIGLVFASVAAMLIHHFRGTSPKLTTGGKVARFVFWACIAIGTVWFLWPESNFVDRAHLVAAGILFAALVVVIVMNALMSRSEAERTDVYTRVYGAIALVMAGALIWGLVLFFLDKEGGGDGWPHWMLLAEAVLILSFAAFWITQTIQLWNDTDLAARLDDRKSPTPDSAPTNTDSVPTESDSEPTKTEVALTKIVDNL